mmetsp:Transcript_16086/g.37917  ORF Transcript_16086/g.37917 Transcript_16086/m.37917 type:complete len:265 (-) Transcript_16086:183-977(-)
MDLTPEDAGTGEPWSSNGSSSTSLEKDALRCSRCCSFSLPLLLFLDLLPLSLSLSFRSLRSCFSGRGVVPPSVSQSSWSAALAGGCEEADGSLSQESRPKGSSSPCTKGGAGATAAASTALALLFWSLEEALRVDVRLDFSPLERADLARREELRRRSSAELELESLSSDALLLLSLADLVPLPIACGAEYPRLTAEAAALLRDWRYRSTAGAEYTEVRTAWLAGAILWATSLSARKFLRRLLPAFSIFHSCSTVHLSIVMERT